MNVTAGDVAPDFTLPDQDGQPWSLSEHRGRPVVLYFYPADNTSGCTAQACDVRDHWRAFETREVAVAGISPDDVASHEQFAATHDLPHTLLADPERTVLQTYGAWGEKTRGGQTRMGVIRSSVVIDADGRVAAVFDAIDPSAQSTLALSAVDDLPSS